MGRTTAHLIATICLSACAPQGLSTQQLVTQEVSIVADPNLRDLPVVREIDLRGSMRDAVRSAVAASGEYRAALARADAALTAVDVADSRRRLQLDLTTSAGTLDERGGSSDARHTGAYGSITASRLIYDGGGVSASVSAAEARAIGAQSELSVVGNDVAVSAAMAWVELWGAQRRLSMLDAQMSNVSTLLEQMERLSSSGMLDSATADRAERQNIALHRERARLAQQVAQAETRFVFFFKGRPDFALRLETFATRDMRQSPQDWAGAPQVVSAAADLVAARADLRARQAAFRPQIAVESRAASPIDENDPNSLSIGLTANYALSTGGRRRAELDEAEANVAAARDRLLHVHDTVQSELAALSATREQAQRSAQLIRRDLELGAAQSAALREQLVTGQADLSAVIEAEVAQFRSSSELVGAEMEAARARLAILAATGDLLTELGLQTTVAE